jgi:site-specific DNA-adenine methylase
MEQGVREAMLKLGNFLLANWLTLQNDRYPAQTIPCRCGDPAHYREMREGVLFTLLGRIVYRRAYYLCDNCYCGTYFTNNRQRMNYPEYRAKRYQIGSGTIESGCKQIGMQRLKVPGAKWVRRAPVEWPKPELPYSAINGTCSHLVVFI